MDELQREYIRSGGKPIEFFTIKGNMSAALDVEQCAGCAAVQICVRCMRYLNERGYNGAYRKECVGCDLNVKDCPLGPVLKFHFNTTPLPGKKEEYLKKDGSGNWIQCDGSGRETEKSVSKIIDAEQVQRDRFRLRSEK
jgi:Na+-translocating ferredoxin:NAD+ oxidoreductase RNF subunit RnfB